MGEGTIKTELIKIQLIRKIEEFRNQRLDWLNDRSEWKPEEKQIRARQIMECDYVCGKIIEKIKRHESGLVVIPASR